MDTHSTTPADTMAVRFEEMSRQTALAALDAVLMSAPVAGEDAPTTLTDWADVRAVAEHVSVALEEMAAILAPEETGHKAQTAVRLPDPADAE